MNPMNRWGFLFVDIFIIMKREIESVVKLIIFKKYPSLYEVKVEDLMESHESFRNQSFVCKIKSDECLSMKEQMEIDTEVKFLFSMLGPKSNSFRKPSIQCFFDCGDGYEFQSSYGYNH
jgi:hypothetical protein